MNSTTLQIEIAYVDGATEVLCGMDVAADCTVRQAIELARVSGKIDSAIVIGPLGIFGRVVEENTRLRDGDRVEIYRPLQADPKEQRRRRAFVSGA